jgi:hypothetical protein
VAFRFALLRCLPPLRLPCVLLPSLQLRFRTQRCCSQILLPRLALLVQVPIALNPRFAYFRLDGEGTTGSGRSAAKRL